MPQTQTKEQIVAELDEAETRTVQSMAVAITLYANSMGQTPSVSLQALLHAAGYLAATVVHPGQEAADRMVEGLTGYVEGAFRDGLTPLANLKAEGIKL